MNELIVNICAAIKKGYLLHFYYESKSSRKKAWRTVRPYLLGTNKAGNLELAALPTDELSKPINKRVSGHYLLESINLNRFETLPESFDDPGVERTRVTHTPTVKDIICRFIYKDENEGDH